MKVGDCHEIKCTNWTENWEINDISLNPGITCIGQQTLKNIIPK